MRFNNFLKKIIYIGISVSLLNGCTSSVQEKNHPARVSMENLPTGSLDSWYAYTYRQIRLARDFRPQDANASVITKVAFLDSLLTGRYLATKADAADDRPVYQLQGSGNVNEDIRTTSVQLAGIAKQLMSMEGTACPDFNFVAVDGSKYDLRKLRGKTILLKCWFIGCVACVQEFPELNALVDRYQSNPDMRFISLAWDSKNALVTFLKKKPFRYAVVPNAQEFSEKELQVKAYPTHFLIDSSGVIRKVTNKLDDLLPSLQTIMK